MSFIGPALPPSMIKQPPQQQDESTKKRVMGPSLDDVVDNDDKHKKQDDIVVKKRVMGPSLDDLNDDDKDNNQVETTNNVKRVMGPSIDNVNVKKRVMGPSLDDDELDRYKDNKQQDNIIQEKKFQRVIGPSIGPARPSNNNNNDDSDSDDDDTTHTTSEQWSAIRNERNNEKGSNNSYTTTTTEREDWMKSIPTDRKVGTNLQNRQFSKNSNVHINKVDSSSWTETREEQERKRSMGPTLQETRDNSKEIFRKNKEREVEEQMNSYNEKYRKESLMDMHKKNLKNTKSSSSSSSSGSSSSGSKTWERDRDMEVGKVDKSRLRDVVGSAKYLNTKFSQADNKYL